MPSPPSKDALQPDFEVKRVGMHIGVVVVASVAQIVGGGKLDRKSTRLNSSHP